MAELPKYDAELSAKLITQAREWRDVLLTPHPSHLDTAVKRGHEIDRLGALNGMVENFAAMADQLEAARREVERLRPVEPWVAELQREVDAWRSKAEVALKLFGETQAEVERLREIIPTCDHCGSAPAVCFGRYEDDGDPETACDMCCGHGNEDGWCVQLIDLPGWAATVSRSAKTLRTTVADAQAEYKLVVAQCDRYDATVAVMRPIVEALIRHKTQWPNSYAAIFPTHIRELVDAYEARPVKP